MANNFIANNSPQKTLSGRLNNIVQFSTELRWLVGFFYFSGWQEVYQNLKKNPEIRIRLLVGLQVGQHLSRIFEHDGQDVDLSSDDYFQDFMTSLGYAINNENQDTRAFYDQVHFFLDMIQEGRLIIRKTKEPNHAKLYLFEVNEAEYLKHNLQGYLITGSSNLTRSGLRSQQEFNVEIKDYGYPEAVAYFEDLWETAVPITEMNDRREMLVDFILHRSQAALVQPFEAYAFILKTFLDLHTQKKLKPQVERLLEENGFKKFTYQIDAVNQALGIIEENNGVIIADVVGLGKSVIASLVARNLDTKGLVICPPGLMGDRVDKSGWWGYVQNFDLSGWEVVSRGKLEQLAEDLKEFGDEYDTVIVDEAHHFRNQDTAAYEALAQICRGKRVILLTATPFNNAPDDIFSLLKLFLIPGRSTITLENNLEGLFRQYNYRFRQLSYILKNFHAREEKKRAKAERLYADYLGFDLPVDVRRVRNETKLLANKIKEIISPVLIRRNRLDLKLDHQYREEIGELPEVESPEEIFYELTPYQSAFYDRIVSQYFSEEGEFTGAIYQPASYHQTMDEEKLGEEENRRFQQQRNLFEFMRRLLVKRFESSFGAFERSIQRFIRVHEIVLEFIGSTNGKYILDRDLIEKIYLWEGDSIDEILYKFENNLLERRTPKDTTVYDVYKFERSQEFLNDIQRDLDLFKRIKEEIEREDLVVHDPKRKVVFEKIEEILRNEPDRKVVLFSEYTDTVRHLEPYFRERMGSRLLICDGNINQELSRALERNFNAQFDGRQDDDFQVLITSDKLSEGFNLNRAGVIINYDIPWNPTRVIQRVGRINRIGRKVFDRLYLFNFFPTETGATFVKSREIAQQKMFMIHNSLGEDAQIFDPEEEPTASKLYTRLNTNPEEEEELTLFTEIRNRYDEIRKKHPEVIDRIEKLPNRVKSAKRGEEPQVNVLRKKGLALFAQQYMMSEGEIKHVSFQDLLKVVECEYGTKRVPLSESFWPAYDSVKSYKEVIRSNRSEIALERKAYNNLKVALRVLHPSEEETRDFIQTLIKDIRHYYTLPKYTLRRLAFEDLKPRSNKKIWQQFWDELHHIKSLYGADYLDHILQRVKDLKEEVIIAVEDRE